MVGERANVITQGEMLRSVPTRDLDPLQAFRKLVEDMKGRGWKADRLWLFQDMFGEESLISLELYVPGYITSPTLRRNRCSSIIC